MRWSYLFSEQFAWSLQSVSIRAHHILDIAARKVYRVIDEGRRKNARSLVFAAICRLGLRVFQLVGAKSAFALALPSITSWKRPPPAPIAERWPLAAPEWAHSLVFQSGVLRYLMFTSKQSRHTAARVQPFQSVFLQQQLECVEIKKHFAHHKRTSISGQINSFHPQRSQLGLLVLRAVEISH